jgi:hypothetical protein
MCPVLQVGRVCPPFAVCVRLLARGSVPDGMTQMYSVFGQTRKHILIEASHGRTNIKRCGQGERGSEGMRLPLFFFCPKLVLLATHTREEKLRDGGGQTRNACMERVNRTQRLGYRLTIELTEL